jgi:hypothetical protein
MPSLLISVVILLAGLLVRLELMLRAILPLSHKANLKRHLKY